MRTAERAQRPGSRRLGGVEATGASLATAGSWPDRRKGWASPEWGPALRLAVMGGMGPGRGALTSPVPQPARLGRRLFWYRRKSTATPATAVSQAVEGLPLPELVVTGPDRPCTRGPCRRAGRESVSPRGAPPGTLDPPGCNSAAGGSNGANPRSHVTRRRATARVKSRCAVYVLDLTSPSAGC